MIELKATTAQEIVRNEKDCDYMDELFGGVKMPPTQVYLKSDADKLIAELENRIDEGDKEFDIANEQNERLLKIVRHQKYKRCLAMAEICRHEWCTMYYERKNYSENKFLDHLMSKKNRHKEKWLELAEKFKEGV